MQRGFTKLFNTIVTSTIWQEDDKTRIVWITMLAIADSFGNVFASAPGLARVANVSTPQTRKAIRKLLDCDPDSRTKDFDGRRIEPIDGGWRILNHAKYRRMMNDEERREYKARWIADKRKSTSVDIRRQSVDSSRPEATQSTQAEAEAEADKEKRGANKSRPTVEDWLVKLESNPAYTGINVRALHAKMVVWCEIRALKPTLRRLVTWLNKEDKPMPKHAATPNYKRNYLPPINDKLTEEQLAAKRAEVRELSAKLRDELKK